MQTKQEINLMSETNETINETYGIIQVKRLEENEDGSANLEIVTDQEATRFLVEIGLTRLLEMALDKDNDQYKWKESDESNLPE
jgi:hypothetical protein